MCLDRFRPSDLDLLKDSAAEGPLALRFVSSVGAAVDQYNTDSARIKAFRPDGFRVGLSIRFAITKDHSGRAAKDNPSRRRFDDLFTGDGPADVSGGEDLVIWLSFEVFRQEGQLDEVWEGTVFVHGFYFAHNPDPPPFLFAVQTAATGGTQPLAKPEPMRRWHRSVAPET